MPGVVAVLTGADLKADGIGPLPDGAGLKRADDKPMCGAPHDVLAIDTARYVGEPVAAVFAMTRDQAEGFYAIHRERPFFNDLCTFMTSGPVVVQVLEGENAVQRNRDIMGATNPANADEGTIRKTYAESIEANSVHGSDSDENAKIEIDVFFKPDEIVG